ncbi:MAG: ATP-binding protein [Bacteroidales bacterium]|nr:ATP-binding protein [Bacteroidales bacterium]HPO65469.1 ATP-binding protein [Bacteroidales bacterium]
METFEFTIKGGDFKSIGYVSNTIKKIMHARNINPRDSRRIAVAIFEVETNIILYATQGTISVLFDNDKITVLARDEGMGIADVALAMREGYTTASDDIRRLGFGAGLGLSNIKKNSDITWISSIVNKGTQIVLIFFLTLVL